MLLSKGITAHLNRYELIETILRYRGEKEALLIFVYPCPGEPWVALRKTQVGNKRMKECRIFGMLQFSKR